MYWKSPRKRQNIKRFLHSFNHRTSFILRHFLWTDVNKENSLKKWCNKHSDILQRSFNVWPTDGNQVKNEKEHLVLIIRITVCVLQNKTKGALSNLLKLKYGLTLRQTYSYVIQTTQEKNVLGKILCVPMVIFLHFCFVLRQGLMWPKLFSNLLLSHGWRLS